MANRSPGRIRDELKLAWDVIAKVQRDLINGYDIVDVLKYIELEALRKASRDLASSSREKHE